MDYHVWSRLDLPWHKGALKSENAAHTRSFASSVQIHFIFRHQNPKTGEFEEKHLTVPPKPSFDKKTNLFTLQLLCVKTQNSNHLN